MSTTVTPFTISTLTSAASLGWVVLALFLILLIKGEAVSAATSKWARALAPSLHIALAPFTVVFVLMWGVRLAELLS